MAVQEITKESFIRGVLTSLSQVPGAPPMDPGALVLTLENDSSDWCRDNTVDLGPLWVFCVEQCGWSEENFKFLLIALEQLFPGQREGWIRPALQSDVESETLEEPENQEEELAPISLSERFAEQRRNLINWIVSGVRKSPIQRVIDPSKMRHFLTDCIDELWENDAVQLLYLWEIMSEPAEVTPDMVAGVFLVMEQEIPSEINLEVVWPNPFLELMAKLTVAQRILLYNSLEVAPPEVLIRAHNILRQRLSTNSPEELSASVLEVLPSLKGLAASIEKQRGSTGEQAAFGQSTGSYSRRSNSSTSRPMGDRTRQAYENTKVIRKQNRQASEPKQFAVPIWAMVGLVFAVLFAAGYYFFMMPSPLNGQQMNLKAYGKYMPLQDLRLHNSTVKVMPKKSFFYNSENVQTAIIKSLFQQIKSNNGFVINMAIYSHRGAFLRYYKPEAPSPPPREPSRADSSQAAPNTP